MKLKTQHITFLILLFSLISISTFGQRNKKADRSSTGASVMDVFNEKYYESLEWRNIGPFRGGRASSVCGVAGKPDLYYMGAAGGGVWKTEDGGQIWKNISDGFFGGSIGAIAVSESDNNVIYAGGGEQTVRGNVSYGYGMWKSVNGGETWSQIGLPNSKHVGRIRIHPQNPDVVFVAVMGDLFKSSNDRGVYKSADGGNSWEKVLFANADAGAVDITFDPNNPRILYASTWKIRRTPYSLSSGGEGSALWKSTDSGETWTNMMENKGLPKAPIGIIGVAVSPLNSNRIWAQIEAKEGGLFRSDDAGKTWSKINEDRNLRQRAWYYTRVYADSQDEDIVYVLNVQFWKSKDGGKSFESYGTPHSDHHDLWIAPENNQRMVVADDGGAQVSYNGAKTWTTYHNQPTSQFYRVTTDDNFPYRIYGSQQDNSSVRIKHRSGGSTISEDDWEPSAGCECGSIAIDPRDPDLVYGACYDGLIQIMDHKTGFTRAISVYPDLPMGHGAEGMKYRFQWNFPLFLSPHNPDKLYAGSNHLHVSHNQGQSWEIISPDLTTNEPSKQVSSGGPITQDNTSVEYYCTIFAAAESPRVKDLIWVGSDDGLVHVTRDGGKQWVNVTPQGLPKWTMINSLEVDPHNDGGCYIAATSYKNGDYRPYLYRTKDYGATWTKITSGIDNDHFTRTVRCDPEREGILYAGTESGMYISFNDGAGWQPLQLNLPVVPITDLAVKNNNLIAATQGRSFWVIDDLTVFHQLSASVSSGSSYLFTPMDTYKTNGSQRKTPSMTEGKNHPGGVMTHFYIAELSDSTTVKLDYLEENGTLIKSFATDSKEKKDKITAKAGANLFTWDMTYPGAKDFKGMIFWWGSLNGPKAVPGTYKVRLTVGDNQPQEKTFRILADPRSPSTLADMKAQFDFKQSVNAKITEAHETIKEIRDMNEQIKNYKERLDPDNESFSDIFELAKEIEEQTQSVEKKLYQTKNKSRQDPLNFPVRLTNKLAHLNSLTQGDYPPTDQAIEVRDVLSKQVDTELAKFETIKSSLLPKFNELVKSKTIDAIILKKSIADDTSM